MSGKKKWDVKMIVLVSEEAKETDMSRMKSIPTKEKAKNKEKPRKRSYKRNSAARDREEPNKNSVIPAERVKTRVHTARSEAVDVCFQRVLRSSMKNTAKNSSNGESNECGSSMPELSGNEKMEVDETASPMSPISPMSLMSPITPDIVLEEQAAKTDGLCGPSMPVLFSEPSPKENPRRFEEEIIPKKIKERRSTLSYVPRSRSRMMFFEDDSNSLSKDSDRETKTVEKTKMGPSEETDHSDDLIKSVAQLRKRYFENLKRKSQ